MAIHKPQYQVIRTEGFIKKTHDLGKVYQRVPELIKAVDWMLIRKPHSFTNVVDDYYLWRTDALTNTDFPMVKILFRIDDENNTVTMISIDDVI